MIRKLIIIVGLIAAVLILLISHSQPQPNPSTVNTSEFGISISTLDGKNVQRLISDPAREMNHARVSPDGQWITFTRYNKKGLGSPALETNGYDETEVMLMRIDGSGLRTIVPSGNNTISANGYWTPKGDGILFVSKAPNGLTELKRYDLASGRVAAVPGPSGMWLSDPHQVGDKIVFPAQDPTSNKKNAIWIMDQDGKNTHQITNPSPDKSYPIDYDPKLSPDGTKVAFMRQIGKDNWHIVIVDLQTGKESDLSAAEAVDGVPEWSSDGRLLVFWHVNPKDLRSSGLYTITPEGKERNRIPLPHGFFYTMPAFFPGEGSGASAHIIFSARKNAEL